MPEDKEWRPLTLGTLPRVKRTIVSDVVLPKVVPKSNESTQDCLTSQFQDTLQLLFRQWKEKIFQYEFSDNVFSHPLKGSNMSTLHQMGKIYKEQTYTRTMMIQEVEQILHSQQEKWTGWYVSSAANNANQEEYRTQVHKLFQQLETKCQQAVEDMLIRQTMELKGNIAMDHITTMNTFDSKDHVEFQVNYRYREMFTFVQELRHSIASILIQ